MRTFDRILTWIAIICVLVLATMGVASAGSWNAGGTAPGNIYSPYVSFDYMKVISADGREFVLDVNNVVSALSYQSSSGTETELLFDFQTSVGDDISVPIRCNFIPISNTTNLLLTMDIDLRNLRNATDSVVDMPEIVLHSSDVIISSERTNSQWLPGVTLRGSNGSYPSFNMTYSASVSYVDYSGLDTQFKTDSNFTKTWSNLDSTNGRTTVWRSSNIIADCQSRQDYDTQYSSGYLYLVEDYSVSLISYDDNFTSLRLLIPYTTNHHTYKQFVSGFELGHNQILTSIVTTIIKEPFTEYPDMTTWLVTAVAGFLDFGFVGISFAGILILIIGYKLVRVVINFFSGG